MSKSKYTHEERLSIGAKIYYGFLSMADATMQFDICEGTARSYLRLYRKAGQRPPRYGRRGYFPLET